MRVAIAGITHETNTFSETPTDLAAFEAYGISRGDEIVAVHAEAHTMVAGFLTVRDEPDVEVVPLVHSFTMPTGTITREAFESLLGEMLGLLADTGPWDAVLLAQHGAAVSAEFPDADLEILRRVRELVGPTVPIGVELDMHANVSAEMVALATVVVGFRTNPHIDAKERGAEVARMITATVRGTIHPFVAFEAIPAVINIVRQSTLESPMRDIMAAATAMLDEPGILSVTVSEGYPYADVAEMGMSCLVISDGSPELAGSAARRLAGIIWAARDQFEGAPASPAEAIRAALRDEAWPTILLDVGDNIGGGGPGNSTVMLEAALAAPVSGLLMILYDPRAVAASIAAGPGATVEVVVGPRVAGMHGGPVKVRGTVRRIADGLYEEPTPTHGGFRFFDMGTTAVLDIGNDNLLVLTSIVALPTSLEQLYSLGINPAGRKLIVAKGVNSPQAAYRRISTNLVYVNTTGVATADLASLEYHRRRRPLFPFERDAAYPVPAGRGAR